MVTPSPRLPGLNGLKLQFHSVPCSLEIVSVPLGPAAAGVPDADVDDVPDVDDDGDDDDGDDDDEQAATEAAASTAAAPVRIRRLIPGVLH